MILLTEFVVDREDLPATVKGLEKNMLKDFERRWQCTKGLKFHDIPQRVSGNRMVGVHLICFIANLLGSWSHGSS
jgi:hypothetical protein